MTITLTERIPGPTGMRGHPSSMDRANGGRSFGRRAMDKVLFLPFLSTGECLSTPKKSHLKWTGVPDWHLLPYRASSSLWNVIPKHQNCHWVPATWGSGSLRQNQEVPPQAWKGRSPDPTMSPLSSPQGLRSVKMKQNKVWDFMI